MFCWSVVLVLFGCCKSAAADPSDVLPDAIEGGPREEMVQRYLADRVAKALADRKAELDQVKTPEDCLARQRKMRALFIEHLGGFPERTPLNAKVVGKVAGDGYHVEKILFESQPQHYVTAALFLPPGKGPFPAVVIPSGHSATAKAAGYNQNAAILLAKHGVAALNYDPIGQGERSQFLNGDTSARFNSTTEHTTVGVSSIPLGRNTSTFRIWDGMRSIDYLTSRSDIDGTKIGATGCSGGGTLSSYLMALDDRVLCAAPSCYLTSMERLLATIGPQDAEQNIHGQIGFGMDHSDYVMLHAPKPTLMLTATRDFFDITGAWDNFRESKRFYTRLGFPERVSLVETDTKHGLPLLQREAMLRWMRRWLSDIDEPTTEPEITVHETAELQCTPQGQTMLLDNARSVIDLNLELNEQFSQARDKRWKNEPQAKLLDEVRRVAGVAELSAISSKAIVDQTTEEQDYTLAKIILSPEPGILLPGLLYTPKKPNGNRILYVHGQGKAAAVGADQEAPKLVAGGATVLAIDLRGFGETGNGEGGRWGDNWKTLFTAYLLGESLVGMRAEDVLCAARYLSQYGQGKDNAQPIQLIATGRAGVPALHAAALEQQLFKKTQLKSTLPSWSRAVAHPEEEGHFVNVIHGALKVYDLPNLVEAIGPDKVSLEAARN